MGRWPRGRWKALVAAFAAASCTLDSQGILETSESGCGNGPACESGLVCESEVCVEPGTGGSSGSGVGGGQGSSFGGFGGTGGFTGGSAGSSGAAGAGNGPGAGAIRCGDSDCSIAQGQVCCANQLGPLPPAYECRTSGSGCSVRYECDGDEDCSGDVCCGTRGGGGEWLAFVCQSSCAGGALHVGCRSSVNCPSGSVCCGTRTGAIFDSYTEVSCSATCDGANQTVLCSSASECGGQNSCMSSTLLPAAFRYCG